MTEEADMEIVIKDGEPAISIVKSPEQLSDAKKLSAFIQKLPLDKGQNDRLVNGILHQIELAEQSGFRQGVAVGAAAKSSFLS